jgi:DNA-binding PadR family transcriptional regulator
MSDPIVSILKAPPNIRRLKCASRLDRMLIERLQKARTSRICPSVVGTTSHDAGAPALTDYEGSLLTLVLGSQPVTAYQLLKIYRRSPVSRFNESKGSLYPLVRRLTDRGLLESCRVASDGRKAQLLMCTRAGRDAVRTWARQIGPTHVLPDDPLAIKVAALQWLSPDEQQEWIATARQMMVRKMAELEAGCAARSTPLAELVQAGAILGLYGRIEWVNLLSRRLDNGADAGPSHPTPGTKDGSVC